jgi:transposase
LNKIELLCQNSQNTMTVNTVIKVELAYEIHKKKLRNITKQFQIKYEKKRWSKKNNNEILQGTSTVYMIIDKSNHNFENK